MTHTLVKCAHRPSPDTRERNMEHNMNKLQMASCCSALSHTRSEEIVHGAQQNPSLHLTRKIPPESSQALSTAATTVLIRTAGIHSP